MCDWLQNGASAIYFILSGMLQVSVLVHRKKARNSEYWHWQAFGSQIASDSKFLIIHQIQDLPDVQVTLDGLTTIKTPLSSIIQKKTIHVSFVKSQMPGQDPF